MSSHPGSTLQEAIKLTLYLKENHIHPEQVQDFYPTPGTISTCMYYTGYDPYTMEEVYVPKTPKEKAMQRALLQYYLPQNREIVLEALKKAKRYDLIGNGSECLVTPDKTFISNKKGGESKRLHNKNDRQSRKAVRQVTKNKTVHQRAKAQTRRKQKPQ